MVKDETTKTLIQQLEEERRVNTSLADSVISINQMVGTLLAKSGVNVPDKSGGTKVVSLAQHKLVQQMKENFRNTPLPTVPTLPIEPSATNIFTLPFPPGEPLVLHKTGSSGGSSSQLQPKIPEQGAAGISERGAAEKQQVVSKEKKTSKKTEKGNILQKCEKCGKNYRVGAEYLKHFHWCLENVKDSANPHVCPEKDCNYRSSSKGGLRTHMDKHFPTKKPCQFCGKLIGRKNLRKHENSTCRKNPNRDGAEEEETDDE